MNIALSVTEPGLDAEIDQRLGRCRFFTIVDVDTLECELIENGSSLSPGGAGTLASQILTGKNIEAVLTGNCGPNAFNVLNAAGIDVYTDVSGKVKDAIEKFKNGELLKNKHASVADHFGSGGRKGHGRGMALR